MKMLILIVAMKKATEDNIGLVYVQHTGEIFHGTTNVLSLNIQEKVCMTFTMFKKQRKIKNMIQPLPQLKKLTGRSMV